MTTLAFQLDEDAAQAVWTLMRDDDDLASEFVVLSVLVSLRAAIENDTCSHLDEVKHDKFHHLYDRATKGWSGRHRELVERWLSYDEVPF